MNFPTSVKPKERTFRIGCVEVTWSVKRWVLNLWHWRTAWAVSHLSRQLQKDKAFRDAWQANIAMPIYDATRPQCLCGVEDSGHHKVCPMHKTGIDFSIHPISAVHANAIADRLMKHLFNA